MKTESYFVTQMDIPRGGKRHFLNINLFVPPKMMYPKEDVTKVFPEIKILLETIEELTGLRVFLERLGEPEEDQFSDELVLCTHLDEVESFQNLDDDDETCGPLEDEVAAILNGTPFYESFFYLHTPVGTFYFAFFQKDETGNPTIRVEAPFITRDMKEILCLNHAQTAYQGDQVIVAACYPDLDMDFPPKAPEEYEEGSNEYFDALKFHQLAEKIFAAESAEADATAAAESETGSTGSPIDVSEIWFSEEALEKAGVPVDTLIRDIYKVAQGSMTYDEFYEDIGIMIEFRNESEDIMDIFEYVVRPS